MTLKTIEEVEEEEDGSIHVTNVKCRHIERFYFLPHFLMILVLLAILGGVIVAVTALEGADQLPNDSILLEKNNTSRLQTIVQTRRLLLSYRATRQRGKVAEIIAENNQV